MKDYSVVGVLSASAENSPYIGGYPLSIQERKIDVADLFNPGTKISASNMSTVTKDTLAKYARTAWNDKDIVP